MGSIPHPLGQVWKAQLIPRRLQWVLYICLIRKGLEMAEKEAGELQTAGLSLVDKTGQFPAIQAQEGRQVSHTLQEHWKAGLLLYL
jgi:hypothetical protein